MKKPERYEEVAITVQENKHLENREIVVYRNSKSEVTDD